MALQQTLPPTTLPEMSTIRQGHQRKLASHPNPRLPPPPPVTSLSHRPSPLPNRPPEVPQSQAASLEREGVVGRPYQFRHPWKWLLSPGFQGRRRQNTFACFIIIFLWSPICYIYSPSRSLILHTLPEQDDHRCYNEKDGVRKFKLIHGFKTRWKTFNLIYPTYENQKPQVNFLTLKLR